MKEWAQWAPAGQQQSTSLFFQSMNEKFVVCGPASHHSPKEINQSINQSNQSNFQFELMIDDCWWFRWRWPPSARSTSIYSFHSQIEAFSWAAKLFNSFFISLNCPFSKSNSKRNKENWVSGGKKSNSSIPSIIDFIIIPLSFHEIPSIIEVLSLFDSFNYCYNIIWLHSIQLLSLNEIKLKVKLLIWLNEMRDCWIVCCFLHWKSRFSNYGIKGYMFPAPTNSNNLSLSFTLYCLAKEKKESKVGWLVAGDWRQPLTHFNE